MSYYITVLTLLLMAEIVIKGSCDTKLECSLLGDLVKMAMKQKSPGCQCLSRTTIPAFQSMLSQPQTPGDKGVIKFAKVVTNIRNGYNPTTGISTTPVAGVYQFSYTVMSQPGKFLIVYLSHNNIKQQTTWLTSHETGTAIIILNLKKGDQVDVKVLGRDTINSNSADILSWFSGYLIAQ